MLYLGLDVASIDGNKPVNWTAAYAAGARFVIFRGTYRTWVDTTWVREAARARHAGLVVGAYLFTVFSLKGPTIEDQIAAFVAGVDVRRGRDFVPALDVEFPQGVKATDRSRGDLLGEIDLGVSALVAAYETMPMIYTSARVWDGEDDDALNADVELGEDGRAAFADCPLWLARYPYKTRIAPVGDEPHERATVEALPLPPVPKLWGPGNVWIHQYQGDALRFPGFSATSDINRFFELRAGARGERVKWLQRKLELAVDGDFGTKTDAAVRAFQTANGLVSDGVVGPRTFAAVAW